MRISAMIDSQIIRSHIKAINEIEATIASNPVAEKLLEKSRQYHMDRIQSKWYGKKYSEPIG